MEEDHLIVQKEEYIQEELDDREIEGLDNSQDYTCLNKEIQLMEEKNLMNEEISEQDMESKCDEAIVATINLNGIGGARSPYKLNKYF